MPAAKPDPALIKPAAKARKPWLLIACIVLLAAGGAGAAAWYFANQSAQQRIQQAEAQAKQETVKVPAPAQYFALEPPFVVNLFGSTSGARYLQIEVQLMTRDPEALKAIEQHAPALRANLLMLFAQQNAEDLVSLQGKQTLQATALREVRKLMSTETGKPGVDALLFTSFVMQ